MSDRDDVYVEPLREGAAELQVRRSRFLGQVRVVSDEEASREALKEISRSMADANHHCWAHRLGAPTFREYYSDAGEPSGSAGKPILGAIQRAGVTNALVVVTRYFGGIKLGVRGLIEAYGAVATAALEASGRAERHVSSPLRAEIPYEAQGVIVHQLPEIGVDGEAVRFSYGERVTLEMDVPLSRSAEAEAFFEGYRHRGSVFRWVWLKEVQRVRREN